MAAEVQYPPTRPDRMSLEDFETASIRSAAPSYNSEAPSYHSTLSAERHGERPPSYTPSTAPPYSRPPAPSSSSSAAPRPAPEASTASIATHSTFSRGAGLPRIPDPFPRNRGPDLNQFRVGTWSSVHRNPNARHYQAVANRRVSAANSSSSSNSSVEALRGMLDRLNEEEEQRATARVRPLEDPHLVGEDAATRARSQRLARESGDEILIREDRHWDWWLAQMRDWEQRSESWKGYQQRNKTASRWRRLRRL